MFKKLLLSTIFAGFTMAAVNINTATKEELMSLKGIGEAKAEAIIEYRKNNKFKSIEDLKNVHGIGDKSFNDLKSELSTSGATSISQSAKEKLSAKTSELKDKASKKVNEAKEKASKTAKDAKKEASSKIESKKEQTKLDLEKKASKDKDKLKQKLDKAISK